MNSRAKVWLALAAATLVLLPATGFAQTHAKPAEPSVEEILKKAIERNKWLEEQNFEGKYAWRQHAVVEQFDSKGGVKKREERVSQVFPVEGEPFVRLVQKDGRTLTAKEVQQQQENERKYRQRIAERKRRKEQKKKDDDVEFDAELVAKYHWRLTGREPVNGRPAFVLAFAPKSKDLPVRTKLDRLLNKVAGRLWVDEQDYELARVDLHLAEDVSAWGGLLASVRKFVLRFEQTKVDEVAWLPRIVDGYIDGRILIKTLHVRVHQENTDFRKATLNVAEKMQK